MKRCERLRTYLPILNVSFTALIVVLIIIQRREKEKTDSDRLKLPRARKQKGTKEDTKKQGYGMT